MTQFTYVDVMVGKSTWQRLEAGQLEEWAESGGDKELFVSVQTFAEEKYEDGKPFMMPLFWDLDGENLIDALKDARVLLGWLGGNGWSERDVVINFSGSRGFHVAVPLAPVGGRPAPDLHLRVRVGASWVADSLKLRTADRSVYTKRRMLRVIGSIRKSGLRAVRLTPEELRTFSVVDVTAAAQDSERAVLEPGARLFLNANEGDGSFWWTETENILAAATAHRTSEKTQIHRNGRDITQLPACLQHLEDHSISKPGDRNKATLAFATFYRASGISEEDATGALMRWVAKVPGRLTGARGQELFNKTKSAVRAIYGREGSYFSCGFVRSLATPCDNECTWIQHSPGTRGIVGEDETTIRLADAVKAEYSGKDICVEGVVTMREKTPKIVPRRLKIQCGINGEFCESCTCLETPTQIHRIDNPQTVLELSESKKKDILPTLLAKLGYPKVCGHRRLEVLESQNIIRGAVQPPCVGFMEEKDEQHRENTIFALASDLDIQAHYRLTGITVPHPINNDAVHIITSMRQLHAPYEHFDVTPEVMKELDVFRGAPPEVFDDIHNDLERSCYPIRGRRTQAIAMDIVIHTALYFDFQGRRAKRGWGQGLAYGDTGQGKTDLLESLFRWYQVGQIISAEDTSLAGLSAGVDRMGNSFVVRLGKLCRNDRGWIGLDEWHGAKEDLAIGTSKVDDDGIVQVTKIIEASAFARVRKWRLANCINSSGKTIDMGARVYGIEHALQIMRTYEDLRRVDIVIGFADTAQIRSSILEGISMNGMAPKYTSDACHTLLQWVASRKPEHISWAKGAEAAVMNAMRYLTDKYHCDLPILLISDAKWKIARLAVGCAARRYNRTEDGEGLIVETADVEFVRDLLDESYSSEDLAFDKYAASAKNRSTTDRERIISTMKVIEQYQFWYYAMLIMLDTPKRFSKRDIIDAVSIECMSGDKPEQLVSSFFCTLRADHAIERRSTYFSLTAKGIYLFREAVKQFEHHRDTGEDGWLVNFGRYTDNTAIEPKDAGIVPF